MRFIVDRIEENRVVLEDENGKKHLFARNTLPPQLREGSGLVNDGGMRIDGEAERLRRKKLFELQEQLKGKRKHARK